MNHSPHLPKKQAKTSRSSGWVSLVVISSELVVLTVAGIASGYGVSRLFGVQGAYNGLFLTVFGLTGFGLGVYRVYRYAERMKQDGNDR